MTQKKRKIIKILLLSVLILVIGGFFVNWFLTYRLQNAIRNEISKRVSEATNGFYTLTYDKLSVGLFNGELKIEGLDIHPDTLEFERLAKMDSLPDVYFNIYINSIDFKGINLAWRINYRKLHFDLFEIKSPDVELFSPRDLNTTDNGLPEKPEQNLYEMVSPFFDEVTVEYLNLQNAKVSYTVADKITPTVYALQDVSFHAFGFRLDENSAKNGKLLYFNDFDFTTNKPQTLLQNSQMILNTEKIELRTQDSIIRITGIELLPQKRLWETTGSYPANFLEAKIDKVEVDGVLFKKEDGKGSLDARLFTINNSNIEYFKIDTLLQQNKFNLRQKQGPDVEEWSLYNIISPLLNSASINRINVAQTTMRYVQVTDGGNDEYLLNNFDFWANGFLVNAQTNVDPPLLYSDNFGFIADSLEGNMISRNHNVSIKKILLDTDRGVLHIKGANIKPISIENKYDYATGTIDSISITGLKTSAGLDAERFLIKSPDIVYTRNERGIASPKKEGMQTEENANTDETDQTSIDMLASVTKHYFIKNIELQDVNFVYKNYQGGKTDVFKINDFNFFARNFLVNDYTRKNIDWYFDCSDFGFSLKSFDNYIDYGMYHLSARDIVFTGLKGRLSLRDVKLLPQNKTWVKAPDMHFKIISPLIEAKGLDYKNKNVKFTLLDVESPQIQIIKERESLAKNVRMSKKRITFSVDEINNILAGVISFNDLKFEYIDKVKDSYLKTGFDKLDIKNILWNLSGFKGIKVNDVEIKSPQVDFTLLSNEVKTKPLNTDEQPTPVNTNLFEAIDIDKFAASDIKVNTNVRGDKAFLDMDAFNLEQLKWKLYGDSSSFGLDKVELLNPLINMSVMYHPKDTSGQEQVTGKKNIYDVLRNFSSKVYIKNFNLNNANVDYNYTGRKLVKKNQKLNNLNLSFEGLTVDNVKQKIGLEDITFSTEDLSFPVDEGFYTFRVGKVELMKRGEMLTLDSMSLKSHYPKMEFAYKHFNHKDWFDLSLGNFTAKGIDIPQYFSDSILRIDDILVKDAMLKNFKNQKIINPKRVSPMIYEKIQKAPLKFDVKEISVKNFNVEYEELARNGETPGKIFFTDMNGHFSGFTNIVKGNQQYNTLQADGKLMGKGYFTATWKMPVDSLNDRFILRAHLHRFDLSELNKIIQPLANANVSTGIVQSTLFNMDASSKGGWIGMSFLYDSLKISILKEKEGALSENKFMSGLTNMVIRSNNPNNHKSNPRVADFYVERDPYHSTFNYFWQMLQPALVESVGVPHRTLNFFKGIPKIPEKLRNFFWKEGSYAGQKEKKENNEN